VAIEGFAMRLRWRVSAIGFAAAVVLASPVVGYYVAGASLRPGSVQKQSARPPRCRTRTAGHQKPQLAAAQVAVCSPPSRPRFRSVHPLRFVGGLLSAGHRSPSLTTIFDFPARIPLRC
jgi:hypothetical protein